MLTPRGALLRLSDQSQVRGGGPDTVLSRERSKNVARAGAQAVFSRRSSSFTVEDLPKASFSEGETPPVFLRQIWMT